MFSATGLGAGGSDRVAEEDKYGCLFGVGASDEGVVDEYLSYENHVLPTSSNCLLSKTKLSELAAVAAPPMCGQFLVASWSRLR